MKVDCTSYVYGSTKKVVCIHSDTMSDVNPSSTIKSGQEKFCKNLKQIIENIKINICCDPYTLNLRIKQNSWLPCFLLYLFTLAFLDTVRANKPAEGLLHHLLMHFADWLII